MSRYRFTHGERKEGEVAASPPRKGRAPGGEGGGAEKSSARAAGGGQLPLVAGEGLTRAANASGRAEFLAELQRTRGNSFVQRFIGEQIVAARGHNSPPTAGPGSHAEPLVAAGATQRVADMKTDAYYRSPVNPTNPVLVWTDGATLFFSPSEEQVKGGRALPAPEPEFAPPAGFRAEEIWWDRRLELAGGAGGSLVVVARKLGEDEVQVAVSNTLEQKYYASALGLTTGAAGHVTREGAEFVMADETSVPFEFSEAATAGEVHNLSFAEGFVRYRAPGGDHDLYVESGPDPAVYLVERASGSVTRSFAAGTVAGVFPETSGVVRVEEKAAKGATAPTVHTIDLRKSPPRVSSAAGDTGAGADHDDAKSRLEALGVSVSETGLRFRASELQAIEAALKLGGGRGLDALVGFRKLEGLTATDPLLEVSLAIGKESGGGLAEAGSGTPLLDIHEPFEASERERLSTVRHEITHVIAGAIDAVSRARLNARQRADLEGEMRFEARRASQKAGAGLLRSAEYGAGDKVPAAGTASDWRSTVGEDPELADVWVELLRRYGFIPDPEGTRELRGTALADESRYLGASDVAVGHPEDSVSEFLASFTASATLFRTDFVAAVLAAETAGNAKGGGGGTYLRRLYRRAWSLIDKKYVPLGPNPF